MSFRILCLDNPHIIYLGDSSRDLLKGSLNLKRAPAELPEYYFLLFLLIPIEYRFLLPCFFSADRHESFLFYGLNSNYLHTIRHGHQTNSRVKVGWVYPPKFDQPWHILSDMSREFPMLTLTNPTQLNQPTKLPGNFLGKVKSFLSSSAGVSTTRASWHQRDWYLGNAGRSRDGFVRV